jgi:hypothetical protein
MAGKHEKIFVLNGTQKLRHNCAKTYRNPETGTSPFIVLYEYFKLTREDEALFPKEIVLSPLNPRAFELPDVVAMSIGQFVISGPLRALIESLDPGLHDFTPIELYLDSAPDKKETYFFFRTRISVPYASSEGAGQTFRCEDLGASNIWSGGATYYCSSKFREAVRAMNLARGWDFKEVTL